MAQESQEDTSAQRAQVLIVDDEPLILSSYSRMLRQLDVDILAAATPGEGLELMERQRVDVVIADYRMPQMNGAEFLELVRRRWPFTVRLLNTAYADVGVVDMAVRRGGIFRFLIKPCDAHQLLSDVKEALHQHRQQQERHLRSQKLQLDLHSFRQVFLSSFDPMMVADLEGNLVEVNEAFVKAQGGSRQQALCRRPTIMGSWEEATFWPQIREEVFSRGHWSGVVQDRQTRRYALLSISLVRDRGKPYALTASEKDVTASRRLEEQTRAAQFEVILALARVAEYRDPDTGAHLERIRSYSRILAEQLTQSPRYSHRLDAAFAESIFAASPLHDIGKVGIPDSVLLKPGKLSPMEWKIIQLHPKIGGQVLSVAGRSLSQNNWLTMARTVALQHHERFDGTGYPEGLRGEEIDISARIVALADAYDAITSKRVYKEAHNHLLARDRIVEGAGTHFDPDVAEAFLQTEKRFLEVARLFSDDDMRETADHHPDGSLDEDEAQLRRVEQILSSTRRWASLYTMDAPPVRDSADDID